MSSPSHQICELQPGSAELVVEPDAEVVQRHPRRQSGTQTLDLMGTLSPEAEGVEEFVIHRLYDLTYPGNPLPQALGPASLFGVALGRMDYLRSVVIEPAAMVFGAFKAFVGYISSQKAEPTLLSLGFGLALRPKNVSARGWSAVEAAPKQKPVITPVGSTAVSKEKPSYHPRLLDQPMSARPASQPWPRRLASRTGMAEASRA